MAVSNGQIVERGDLLARIDPRHFQLKTDRARAALDLATQSVGAGSSEMLVRLIRPGLVSFAVYENQLI